MNRRLTIALLAVVLMAGAFWMNTVMNSWVGSSIDDVTAAWGAPTEE